MANRQNIYYWKCDRPNAFVTLGKEDEQAAKELIPYIEALCIDFFGNAQFEITKAFGQGNHRNFIAYNSGEKYFIRIENSNDNDEYMVVESEIISQVNGLSIPVPHIFKVDCSRKQYPFAYQIMETLKDPDVNSYYKQGELETSSIMFQLGRYIAMWQDISFDGFGLFDSNYVLSDMKLRGLYPRYRDYYFQNLDTHLNFLKNHGFLSSRFVDEIFQAIINNSAYLDLGRGCLVHKDIAFWNIIGTPTNIFAIIDWDDAIAGDPTDDISLMACFHSWEELKPLIMGYEDFRELPAHFEKRFWLHFLRNMIFKSVIRVGAGYFNKSKDFFLIGTSNSMSKGLADFTMQKINDAYQGLVGNKQINDL